MADVQIGFGSFLAFYLADLGWSKQNVGLALTVGGLAGVLFMIPGGALSDAARWKRGLTAAGIIAIGIAALILALQPSVPLAFAAEILQRLTDLGKNWKLLVFGGCLLLFHLANSPMLPLVSQNLAHGKLPSSSLFMAALLIVPQIVVAVFAPWVGYWSELWGRKPLLLAGFLIEAGGALVFAF